MGIDKKKRKRDEDMPTQNRYKYMKVRDKNKLE
jgi:hypothetical protein